MITNHIVQSVANVRGLRQIVVLVISVLIIVMLSPAALVQSATTGEFADSMVYLPLAVKNFPLVLSIPVLDAISNGDGDGNYTVSWSPSEGADVYTLQEDDNAGFSSPTTVYSGPLTSTAISGRDSGTYYYRVRASYAQAESDWSNVESVTVTTPLPGCPETWAWVGDTSQGGGRRISFGVENSPQCQITAESLKIAFRDSCGSERTTVFMYSIPIANNHFDTGVAAGSRVIGDFTTPTTASGTFSYDSESCTASGTWTAALNLGANSDVLTLALQTDGKILVGGSFTALGGQPRPYIGRLNPDGTIDASFNPEANGIVKVLAVQSDGKIVVGGYFTRMSGQVRYLIARLNPDGSLDSSFNPGNNGAYWRVNALVIQADGKIVVGGKFEKMGGVTRNYIARLNPDGTLDTAFDPAGDILVYTDVHALALQADGKILVGMGCTGTLCMSSPFYRLNPDGSRDTDFSVSITGAAYNTYVYTLLVQADGKIVVGGNFTKMGGQTRSDIGRLNPDGTIDASFNPEPGDRVYALAQQSDNKIVVGGAFSTLGGQSISRLGRLETDGTPDATFNPTANSTVEAVLVQADGKIVAGGHFSTMGGEAHYYIARVNPDGTIDAVFP